MQDSTGKTPSMPDAGRVSDPPPSPAEEEIDDGYGPSHGYGPGHGGPSGPGDVPAAPAPPQHTGKHTATRRDPPRGKSKTNAPKSQPPDDPDDEFTRPSEREP